MKLQNLTVIFIIIILPIVLVLSAYIGYEVQTIKKQNLYNTGLMSATSDAIFAFELNTKNDIYYNNAESKRSNIKAAVKTFENSLSNTCNLGLYNNQAIEEYIPAIVFGLYDGFYMYAPTQTQNQGYKHDLKNYVYYSETIPGTDIVIRYTLDNYVAVSGTIGEKYVTKAGYLINLKDLVNRDSELKNKELKDINKVTYKNVTIEKEHIEEYGKDKDTGEINKVIDNPDNDLAISYYKKAYEFTNWFMNEAKIGQTKEYLKIGDENDPEDENSPFVQHKREIMKNKIQSILNSSITAYSNKTRNNYKMPVLRAEDWDKIYNNISVISFVQGINLGFKNYNHYCVLNSTNSQEYVNPNLIYFTDGNSYHDIRCTDTNVDWSKAVGYKIGSFEKQTYEHEVEENGKKEIKKDYYYKHNELACYSCINGTQRVNKNIYNYMNGIDENSITEKANDVQKRVYYSALARERESTVKLLNAYNSEILKQYTITYEPGETNGKKVTGMPEAQTLTEGEHFTIPSEVPTAEGLTFLKWKVKGSNTEYDSGIEIPCTGDITLVAQWEEQKFTVTFDTDGGSNVPSQTIKWGEKVTEPPTPNKTGYRFMGWNTNNGQQFDFNTSIESDITLYANWESKETQIRYSLDGNIIEELTTKANVGSIYKPITNILNGRENYSDKILLGYTYSNGGKVNYNENMTIPDKDELTLNVVYVNNNSIKCEVSQNIKDKTCNQFDHKFYTNTTGNITAKITSENSNGSPTITSSISNGRNTSSKNGNTYTINSTEEGSNIISASMTLSKNGVSRSFSNNFIIIVDRTAPTVEKCGSDWLGYLFIDVKDNLSEVERVSILPGTLPVFMYPNIKNSGEYSKKNYSHWSGVSISSNDRKRHTVTVIDRAGNAYTTEQHNH